MVLQAQFMVSVMGNCSVVLFDEPTSGLDPESRRLLWNVMLALFQQSLQHREAVTKSNFSSTLAPALAFASRSCVLTTHSLEEAEALCSRIGIMLHGEIFALGAFCTSNYSTQYILIHAFSFVKFQICITMTNLL